MTLKDFRTIYVYQVDQDTYEVDWELTTMTPSTFEAVALAAYMSEGGLLGVLFGCRKVAER